MPLRGRVIILSPVLLIFCTASQSFAGMTSYTLTDVARMRLQDISFFAFVLVLCVFGVKWMWNLLARDFPKLPRLGLGRAFALTTLVSLLLLLVLAIISGARELLTPGAWRRQGHGYRINADASESTRRQGVEALRVALFGYAEKHGGILPPHDFVPEIPDKLWQSPDGLGSHYIYIVGLKTGSGKALLAYEPPNFGDSRFCLLTDGEIVKLPLSEIHARLPKP
jgi:hypothetical protein